MDISTSLGILGVLLTVLFFVIGYRQTIGARKERARAANKEATDTLFRRLTLEDGFSIKLDGVNKILEGLSLQSKVRRGDLYTVSQLESVLYAKLLDSDYINSDARKDAIARLEKSFSEASSPIELPALSEKSIRLSRISQSRTAMDSTFWLAAASGSIAIVLISLALTFVEPDKNKPVFEFITSPSAYMLIILVFITSAMLTFYVRLRDDNRSTLKTDDYQIKSEEMERAFFSLAKRSNNTVSIAGLPWADLTFSNNEQNFAVEFKGDLNRIGMNRVRSIVQMMTKFCEERGFSGGYLISGVDPSEKIRAIESATVKILSVPEMLSILRKMAKTAA